MKVIITGATGLVGGAVVRHCIANEKITHAFVLTRKPLPELVTDPKVTVVTHDDFSTYPADLLERLAGAEGCIWSVVFAPQRRMCVCMFADTAERAGRSAAGRRSSPTWRRPRGWEWTTRSRRPTPLRLRWRRGCPTVGRSGSSSAAASMRSGNRRSRLPSWRIRGGSRFVLPL